VTMCPCVVNLDPARWLIMQICREEQSKLRSVA
jgi:hypothetical protein